MTNTKAAEAFTAAKAEIDTMLDRLAALSADHFNASPDEIHWGHVGELSYYSMRLRELSDLAFQEGEHAA